MCLQLINLHIYFYTQLMKYNIHVYIYILTQVDYAFIYAVI